MKKEKIKHFVRDLYPLTTNSMRVEFFDKTFDVGFFTNQTEDINEENKWRFQPNNFSSVHHPNSTDGRTITIDGDQIKSITLL